jgi:superfamily II DNA or RNA helicase
MTATLLHLREYQREAIDAVYKAWDEGMQRPAVVLATGLGKTIVFSHLISEFIESTGQRAVVLVHRDELADQAIGKLRDVAPDLNIGKVKAESNETDAQVVVASVQTLARTSRLDQLVSSLTPVPGHTRIKNPIGLVIADEVHHYASKTFRGVLEGLGCFRPDGTKLVGFTATMARGDGVGLGGVVDDVVYEKGTMFGISRGFLVPPEGRLIVSEGLDLSRVKKTSGDYAAGDLGRALEDSGAAAAIPGIYAEHAAGRQGIVFTPTVATARSIADAFSASGVPAAMVCGETPRDERLHIFDEYRRGRLQVMTNAMVLTEGFDMPQASCAVIARPTQSQPLYVQMVGRVLRPFPGKTDALILDVVGASANNKLMTLIDLEPGLFPDLKPCDDCERIPCICPCEACGKPKLRLCECPRDTPDLEIKTDGVSGEIDLFAASSQTWLTTARGVMFIPAGAGEVFLWASQTPGTWDVAFAPKSGAWERLHTSLPIGTAMAWAETEADDRSGFNIKKSAAWKKTKPSEGQIVFARQLGVEVTDKMTKGEIGNEISVRMASRKIDRRLPKT